jgi:hypothetical protein
VAFTATSNQDSWNAGDVKFNPTVASYSDYTAIPCWNGGGGGDGYISSAAYHTLENVKAGRGDICKLAGLTTADIDAGDYDNGKFRLPIFSLPPAVGTIITMAPRTACTPVGATCRAIRSMP